ncbi:hypothetical protein YC2023_083208 [Brassica napus]
MKRLNGWNMFFLVDSLGVLLVLKTLSLVSGCKWALGTGKDTAVKVFTEELVPANPDILEGVADLIQLSYLN